MQNSIKIEKINSLNSGDFAGILEIEDLSFKDPWSPDMFRINDDEFIIVARTMNKITAYICCMRILNECHILNVAVHPEMRGIGLASMLFKWLLTPENGDEYYLEVRKTNADAIKLYEKFGFTIIGIRPKYYQDGEDAFVMKKEL